MQTDRIPITNDLFLDLPTAVTELIETPVTDWRVGMGTTVTNTMVAELAGAAETNLTMVASAVVSAKME